MTSGTIIRETKTAIQSTVKDFLAVEAVWGFGSFFRCEAYNDVDVLIVLSVPHEELTELTSALRSAFMIAERDLALQFDLLFLTPEEFSSRPLRDMDQLVLLYQGAARV